MPHAHTPKAALAKTQTYLEKRVGVVIASWSSSVDYLLPEEYRDIYPWETPEPIGKWFATLEQMAGALKSTNTLVVSSTITAVISCASQPQNHIHIR